MYRRKLVYKRRKDRYKKYEACFLLLPQSRRKALQQWQAAPLMTQPPIGLAPAHRHGKRVVTCCKMLTRLLHTFWSSRIIEPESSTTRCNAVKLSNSPISTRLLPRIVRTHSSSVNSIEQCARTIGSFFHMVRCDSDDSLRAASEGKIELRCGGLAH